MKKMNESRIPVKWLFHIKRHIADDEQMKIQREANEQLSADSKSEIYEKSKSHKLTLHSTHTLARTHENHLMRHLHIIKLIIHRE